MKKKIIQILIENIIVNILLLLLFFTFYFYLLFFYSFLFFLLIFYFYFLFFIFIFNFLLFFIFYFLIKKDEEREFAEMSAMLLSNLTRYEMGVQNLLEIEEEGHLWGYKFLKLLILFCKEFKETKENENKTLQNEKDDEFDEKIEEKIQKNEENENKNEKNEKKIGDEPSFDLNDYSNDKYSWIATILMNVTQVK